MTDRTDKTTFAPFILMETGKCSSLILTDDHMVTKAQVFEERGDEGWIGSGYDWNSIAQVVVAEQMPDLQGELSFDPEAGMFAASGSRASLERLGRAMSQAFHSDEAIRDLLSRAELD